MAYVRQDVHGTSGQDILKINENFMNIFEKVFGDINYSDVDTELQKRINKQWIPVQGEGNLDSSNPLKIRFFIPPNTTKLVSSNFNVITENYRMDSSVTDSAESSQEVVSIVSSTEPASTYTSTTAPKQTQTSSTEPSNTTTSSSATVGVSGVSSVTVGVSSVSGISQTSNGGGGSVEYVRKWGTYPNEYYAPTQDLTYGSDVKWLAGGYVYTPGRDDMGLLTEKTTYNGQAYQTVDFMPFQHSHQIPTHYHTIPSHYHTVSLNSHTHSISLQPHSHTLLVKGHQHTVEIEPHSHEVTVPSHTHTINGSVTIPSHSHVLNEGVKISSTNPVGVSFKINGTVFSVLEGNNAQNNLDITGSLRIGEWNVIEVTASTVARAVVYGTVELIAI